MWKRLSVQIVLLPASMTAAAREAPPAPPPTGRLHLTFTERSPLSSAEEMAERTRLDTRRWPKGDVDTFPGRPANWATRDWDYDLARESFTVYVPEAYNPRTAYGILVWTGVSEFSQEWFPILSRRKLIFVDPDKRDRTYVPAGLWVDAVHNLKKRYTIDDNRVYSAGFSSGGRYAGHALITHPDVFRGCFCIAGDDFYDDYKNAITVEPAVLRWHGSLDDIKKSVRIVLMRGERDTFTPEQGRRQFEGLILDGFEHVAFFVAPGIGHQHPNAAWFEKGINALDKPPNLKPPTTVPTNDPRPTIAQLAQAKRVLHTAQFWHETGWPTNPGPGETRRYLQQVIDDYPTTPSVAQARDILNKLDSPSTRPVRP